MAKVSYTKNPISINRQIDLLEEKGMIFCSKLKALRLLSIIGYYRFSGYAYSFRNRLDNSSFMEGTSFEQVYSIYEFDRNLKLILFKQLAKIEIAFRTLIINEFSLGTESIFWFAELANFSDEEEHTKFLAKLKEEIDNSQEDFIFHFKKTYSDTYPPSWIALQLISFGALVKLYRNFKNVELADNVARAFGCESTERFISWINTLVYLRNICGHHSRLWNLSIKKRPLAYHFGNKSKKWDNQTIYYSVCVVAYLLHSIYPENDFKDDLIDLFHSNTYVNKVKEKYLGFPKEWEKDIVWK